MITLTHQIRLLANRLPPDDAQVLWRAANQLESLQVGMGEQDKSESATTLQAARDVGERKHLLAVLFEVRGNRTWAADRLRISRTALYKVLRKHGLKVP
jgi:DNA-binding NtrC family response regulator